MPYLSIRHQSRILVLQSLYESYIDPEKDTKTILARNIETSGYKVDEVFCAKIIDGVATNRPAIDELISKTAPEWPINQIAAIDLAILRMSIFELMFDHEVPPKAVINEAVELGKSFGGDNSGKFINGVLGTIFRASDKFANDEVVTAAGGIVYRETTDGKVFFLAIRNMYHKWTFPKGKVEEGETWQEAALREIKEETGIETGEIIGEIGEIQFIDKSEKEPINKNIHFYLVKTEQEEVAFDEASHVTEIKWMREDEVRESMDYPNLVDLFNKALSMLEATK
ncbi:MAG: transcription antitermination factor NusB [Patescibacteria group bacterium]